MYNDISMDSTLENFSFSAENNLSNCACSLNAMVICEQCCAFCHDDCMGTSKLCASCIIR